MISDQWPDVWTAQAVKEKRKLYPWLISSGGRLGCLYCKDFPVSQVDRKSGICSSKEWTGIKVGFDHDDPRPRATKLSMLRSKISQHLKSAAHTGSTRNFERSVEGSDTQHLLANQYKKHQSATEKLFRVAYNIAKMNRPYTDFSDHIDCYKLNGVDVGVLLHTDKSCAAIINSISEDMKKTLLAHVLTNESKFSILIDESTTISNKTGLVIHLRACINGQPTTFFLDLVHLETSDAESVVDTVLKVLSLHGFTNDILCKHLICFASDGASVMTGTKSGVGLLLLKKYPNIILWHCANHRLELAVNDSVNEVAGINHFKCFMDTIYALYSQSPKLQHELKDCARALDVELCKIGKVLDTRWSASSLRSVKAVWRSFPALVDHFSKYSHKPKFSGLLSTITCPAFVQNLAVMFDALEEISLLSLSLQKQDLSFVAAHKLIKQTIQVFDSYACNLKLGKHELEAQTCIEAGEFHGHALSQKKIPLVNRTQFYRSLVNSISSRLLTTSSRKGEKISHTEANRVAYNSLLSQMSILDSNSWPVDYDSVPGFGICEIESICKRFNLEPTQYLVSFRQFLACGGRELDENLVMLSKFLRCVPISTAECERAFSVMNNVLTPLRNKLEFPRLSNLMFVSIVGPPIQNFNPSQYALNWLKRGHHGASDSNSIKRKTVTEISNYTHVHTLL